MKTTQTSNPRDLLRAAAAPGTVFAFMMARWLIGSPAADYAGPLLWFHHLYGLVLTLALLALCAGVGRLALRRAGLEFGNALESLIFAAATGAGITATLMLILGLSGGLRLSAIVLLLLTLATAARKELAELPDQLRKVASWMVQGHEVRAEWLLCGVVLAAVALFLVTMASAPPVDWDALMYHLEVPTRFVEAGRVHLPEDNLHVAFVGLAHMLYVPLLALGSTTAPAMLSAALMLLLGLSVATFSQRFFAGVTTPLSLALIWGTPTILLVASTPRVDTIVTLYLFLAHYALFLAMTEETVDRYLYVAAALLGFAFGVKYQAVPYALALTPLVIWIASKRGRTLKGSVRPLAGFVLVGVIVALPWMLKNAILLGAPFYPFLSATALEPWLVPIYGSRSVPASVDLSFLSALANVRQPFNLRDVFLAPERLTIEVEGAFYFANPILILVPLWVIFVRNRLLTWLVIPALGYLAILILPYPATNLRYLIPAIIPLTIVVVHMAVMTAQRLAPAKAVRWILLPLTLLALFPAARAAYIWMSGTQALSYLAGTMSREGYLANHLDPGVRVYAPLIEYINANVPAHERMLMLYDARSYYLEPAVIQDNRLSNWPFLEPKLGAGECLEVVQASYVILAIGSFRYYIQRGLDADVMRWPEFLEFADRCLTVVHESPGFVVFKSR